ncbi:MAG: matrixin family metalloprotease [Candidatus Paceibacterota bacterium]|jgi:hypothetical protein
MKSLLKTLFNFFLIILSVGAIYHYRDNWINLIIPPKPCSKPLTYSIGTFDTRFGITKEEFKKDIQEAGNVWGKQEGKQLFEYSDTGTLKINLTYDYRQKATDQMKEVGVGINYDRETYNVLKTKFDSETSLYNTQREVLNQEIADYASKKTEYERQVNYWNSQGGAPQEEYQTLQEQRASLNNQVSTINKETTDLNLLGKELNATADSLNTVAKKLNIKVSDYNTIGSSTGEEFSEGEYIRDGEGVRINVYQFDTNKKLVRLLEHELGHALGFNHVEDPRAIMYRLNTSTNQLPTSADIAELKRVCAN